MHHVVKHYDAGLKDLALRRPFHRQSKDSEEAKMLLRAFFHLRRRSNKLQSEPQPQRTQWFIAYTLCSGQINAEFRRSIRLLKRIGEPKDHSSFLHFLPQFLQQRVYRLATTTGCPQALLREGPAASHYLQACQERIMAHSRALRALAFTSRSVCGCLDIAFFCHLRMLENGLHQFPDFKTHGETARDAYNA